MNVICVVFPWGVPKIAPEENCPQSGSEFGLKLALELGLGGNFPRTDIWYTILDKVSYVFIF